MTISSSASKLEVKATSTSIIATDDETGIVEALVSITGIVDDQGDIIEPGAYADTLAIRRPKVVRDHQWSAKVGRALAVEEWPPGDARLPTHTAKGDPWPVAAGALWTRSQYNLKTKRGEEAYEDVKFYSDSDEAQWSIGYSVPKNGASRGKDGIRRIKALDLWEYSDVLHGAAPLTMTLGVKTAEPDNAPEPEVEQVEPVPPLRAYRAPAGFVVEPIPQVKAAKVAMQLAGSFEETREQVVPAVQELLGGNDLGADGEPISWVYVVGTWPDRVVATRSSEAGRESFEIPFTVEADTVQLGDPVPVQLRLHVEPAGTDDPAAVEEAAVKSLTGTITATASTAALALAADVKAGRILSALNAGRVRKAVAGLNAVLLEAGLDLAVEPAESPKAGEPHQVEPPAESDEETLVELTAAEIAAVLVALAA